MTLALFGSSANDATDLTKAAYFVQPLLLKYLRAHILQMPFPPPAAPNAKIWRTPVNAYKKKVGVQAGRRLLSYANYAPAR